jgi:HSP20 family protein
MAMIRWEPARELSTLQNEMNRLFGTYFDTPAAPSGARRWVPAMDLVETPEHFVLKADLPGLREQDVKIEVEENVLTISGERREEHETKREGYHRIERSTGAFSRSLTLPKGVDAGRISATFADGVLTVEIPKPEERKPRRVSISVGSPTVEGTEASEPTPVGAAA